MRRIGVAAGTLPAQAGILSERHQARHTDAVKVGNRSRNDTDSEGAVGPWPEGSGVTTSRAQYCRAVLANIAKAQPHQINPCTRSRDRAYRIGRGMARRCCKF